MLRIVCSGGRTHTGTSSLAKVHLGAEGERHEGGFHAESATQTVVPLWEQS